jgi:hypothetical protein
MSDDEELVVLIILGLFGFFLCMVLSGISIAVENAVKKKRRAVNENRRKREYYVRLCQFSQTSFEEQQLQRQLRLFQSLGVSELAVERPSLSADTRDQPPSYKEAEEMEERRKADFEMLPNYEEALGLA